LARQSAPQRVPRSDPWSPRRGCDGITNPLRVEQAWAAATGLSRLSPATPPDAVPLTVEICVKVSGVAVRGRSSPGGLDTSCPNRGLTVIGLPMERIPARVSLRSPLELDCLHQKAPGGVSNVE